MAPQVSGQDDVKRIIREHYMMVLFAQPPRRLLRQVKRRESQAAHEQITQWGLDRYLQLY